MGYVARAWVIMNSGAQSKIIVSNSVRACAAEIRGQNDKGPGARRIVPAAAFRPPGYVPVRSPQNLIPNRTAVV